LIAYKKGDPKWIDPFGCLDLVGYNSEKHIDAVNLAHGLWVIMFIIVKLCDYWSYGTSICWGCPTFWY